MTELLAIGVDPGPTPGVVALRWCTGPSGLFLDRVDVLQCGPLLAPSVVRWLVLEESHPELRVVVQTERFVVGRGSQRAGRAGAVTRDVVGAVEHEARGLDAVTVQRAAVQVKAWATDLRMAAAELLEPTKSMRHARDAARHALFAAVHDGGAPDPLSTRSAA